MCLLLLLLLILECLKRTSSSKLLYTERVGTTSFRISKLINKAAQEMCLQNPMYLRSRQKLLDAARTKVDQTYAFKKGKSRSKKYSTDSEQSASK